MPKVDVAVVWAQRAVFRSVASDATVSHLIAALAADVDVALPAIRAAHAGMRGIARRERPHAAPSCTRIRARAEDHIRPENAGPDEAATATPAPRAAHRRTPPEPAPNDEQH